MVLNQRSQCMLCKRKNLSFSNTLTSFRFLERGKYDEAECNIIARKRLQKQLLYDKILYTRKNYRR